MKSILMSIQPQYVAKILNGEKTIEIRKRFPRDYRGWVYIYCTKDMNELLFLNDIYDEIKPHYDLSYKKTQHNVEFDDNNDIYEDIITDKAYLNGKVLARFWCDKMEEYVNGTCLDNVDCNFGDYIKVLKSSCLTEDELYDYCQDLSFSAIHISQLEIFDKPKELSDFFKVGAKKWYNEHAGTDMPYLEFWNTFDDFRITKAPQSMQYIEVVE